MDAKFDDLLSEYKNDINIKNYLEHIMKTTQQLLNEIEKNETRNNFVTKYKICIDNKFSFCQTELMNLLDVIKIIDNLTYSIKTIKFGKTTKNDIFYFGDMIILDDNTKNINIQLINNFFKNLGLKNTTIYTFFNFIGNLVDCKCSVGFELFKAEIIHNKYESLKHIRYKYPQLFSKYINEKKIIVLINETDFDNKKQLKDQTLTKKFMYDGTDGLLTKEDNKIFITLNNISQKLAFKDEEKKFYDLMFE